MAKRAIFRVRNTYVYNAAVFELKEKLASSVFYVDEVVGEQLDVAMYLFGPEAM
jgi:hypothetical protein